MHSLSELTDKIGSGSTPRGGDSAYKETGIPLVRSMNVHDGAFKPDGLAFIDNEQARLLQNVTLQKGDVLINITGASVARSCVLPDRYSGGRVNQHVAIIRPKQKVDSGFLNYFLTADATKRKLLNTAGGGATREALTKSQLEALEIPLPPLAEQKRIAAILDKADQLRQKRRQTITLLDSLTQSIFPEMFGANPTNTVPLSELCNRITDGTHQAPNWSASGVPFLFVSNIRNQIVSFDTNKYVSVGEYERLTKNCPIEAGDVLYTAVGSYGNAAVVPAGKTFVFQRHIAHIKPRRDRIRPVYLSLALESLFVRQQADRVARGVAQKTVTLASMRDFEIPLPKIEDQELLEQKIIRMRNLRMTDDLQHLGALFSSIQHRAFSGQL